MISYKSYIQLALKDKHTISVWDGEEWQVNKSTDYRAIVDAIQSVEQSEIRIRDAEGELLGWAMLIPSDEGIEDIVDHDDNVYMHALHKEWVQQ